MALRTYYEPAMISPERAVALDLNNQPTIVYNTKVPSDAGQFMGLPGMNEGLEMTENMLENESSGKNDASVGAGLPGMFKPEGVDFGDAPETIEEAQMNSEVDITGGMEETAQNELIQDLKSF